MAPQLINSKKKSKNNLNYIKYKKIKETMKNYQKFIQNNFKYVFEIFSFWSCLLLFLQCLPILWSP